MTTALWRIATQMGAGAIQPICIAAVLPRQSEHGTIGNIGHDDT
jgi:hypothetical protein